jgi:hypothetical protein
LFTVIAGFALGSFSSFFDSSQSWPTAGSDHKIASPVLYLVFTCSRMHMVVICVPGGALTKTLPVVKYRYRVGHGQSP